MRQDIFTAQFEGLKALLTGLLGLNVFGAPTELERREAVALGTDPDAQRIVPLSLMLGQPEVMQHIQKEMKKQDRGGSAASDAAFDAFSSELHNHIKTGHSALPDDLVPDLLDDLGAFGENSYWFSEGTEKALQRLGIKPRRQGADVAHIDKRPAQKFGARSAPPSSLVDPADFAESMASSPVVDPASAVEEADLPDPGRRTYVPRRAQPATDGDTEAVRELTRLFEE